MKIKKGDKFVCIKNVKGKKDNCFYFKGHFYLSIFDDCITDEFQQANHYWGGRYSSNKKHFVKLK
jgi:hypothetical protein